MKESAAFHEEFKLAEVLALTGLAITPFTLRRLAYHQKKDVSRPCTENGMAEGSELRAALVIVQGRGEDAA